jgi:hypothetical protein
LEPSHVVSATEEKVEDKRDIDGMPAGLQGEFELVLVIDVAIEIGRFCSLQNSIGRLIGGLGY